jgi:hypothetical protein
MPGGVGGLLSDGESYPDINIFMLDELHIHPIKVESFFDIECCTFELHF